MLTYSFIHAVFFLFFLLFFFQDSLSSPVEENISHELFDGEPAVAKYKVGTSLVIPCFEYRQCDN